MTKKYLCKTGEEYEECTNLVEAEGEYCECCKELSYQNAMDSLVENQ